VRGLERKKHLVELWTWQRRKTPTELESLGEVGGACHNEVGQWGQIIAIHYSLVSLSD
jgi:hypothetical protein